MQIKFIFFTEIEICSLRIASKRLTYGVNPRKCEFGLIASSFIRNILLQLWYKPLPVDIPTGTYERYEVSATRRDAHQLPYRSKATPLDD